MSEEENSSYIELAAQIVSSYAAHNSVASSDLPLLIVQVHAALRNLGAGAVVEPVAVLTPAVPIRRSVTDEYIVCLDDGLKFKSLKRHLSSKYGMTPADYRAKWGLPADYPMVAPGYAAQRSALARASGLGQSRRLAPAPEPEKAVAKKPRKSKNAAS